MRFSWRPMYNLHFMSRGLAICGQASYGQLSQCLVLSCLYAMLLVCTFMQVFLKLLDRVRCHLLINRSDINAYYINLGKLASSNITQVKPCKLGFRIINASTNRLFGISSYDNFATFHWLLCPAFSKKIILTCENAFLRTTRHTSTLYSNNTEDIRLRLKNRYRRYY